MYELARKGITVEREARPIRVDAIELLEAAGTRLVFRVRCSKGTYIRVMVEDIAKVAGTVAHTSRLHREEVGDFLAADMLDLSVLETAAEEGSASIREHLMSPDVALAGYPAVTVSAADGQRFSGGMVVPGAEEGLQGLVRVYSDESQFLGVGEATGDGSVAPKRVFLMGEKNP